MSTGRAPPKGSERGLESETTELWDLSFSSARRSASRIFCSSTGRALPKGLDFERVGIEIGLFMCGDK